VPLYVVRWPNLSASFVQAEGEEDLLNILDQVGNADDCEWSLYRGPLFIDFRLPVEWNIRNDRSGVPLKPQQVVIGDVSGIGSIVEALQVSLAEGDDGYETGAELLRLAFPKLHAAIEKSYEAKEPEGLEGGLPEAKLRKALHAELERFIQASWRRAQLQNKSDAISQLALEMDLSVQLARKYEEIALGENREQREPTIQENQDAGAPLFVAFNHHTDSAGRPPSVHGDGPGKYYGYFANECGEQAIFVYDYETEQASVQMGDAGWGSIHRVIDGRAEGINLSEAEVQWIQACWLAAKGSSKSGF
jgi:hypothetical protein